MKPWLNYIRSHPLLSIGFTAILTTLATAAAFRDDWLWGLASAYVVLTGIVCFLVWRHSCVLCICLCCVLVSSPGWPQELPPQTTEPEVAEGGIILGGAVIVVGGGAAYLLWRFCQKHFPPPPPPPPTNAPPVNPTNSLPETASVHALGLDIDLGSCPQNEQEAALEATTSYVTAVVGPGGSIQTSVRCAPAESFAALRDQLAVYGLDMTGHYQAPVTTVNGEAASSDVVTWLPDSRTVRVQRDGEALYRVSLEVSPDLRAWQPLARVECEAGMRITFSDTQAGSPWFYRTTSQLAD